MPIEARTVFCDDIRREDSGKMILIGVYAEDLIPGTIPSTFPLSFWIVVNGGKIDKGKLTISILQPGGNEFKLDGQIGEVPADANTSLVFTGLPMQISEPGLIKVQLTFDNNKPIEAGSLIVRPPLVPQTGEDASQI